LAIAADFLDENRIYPFEFAGRFFVVITSEEGANRVYETGEVRFARCDDSCRVQDRARGRWQVEEEALVGGDHPEIRLPRVTANRAFWFGWYAQFPQTQLIQ
jgi:hypothetical protein